jgi:hypothetical protein
MSERRRYTHRQKAAAVVTAELASTMAAAEATGIPESTVRYWLDDPRFAELRTKTREEAAAGFSVLMHKAQERLEALIPTMDARDLTVLLGVVTDKNQLLAGQPTGRLETVTGGLEDHEKEQLRAAIRSALAREPVR